MLWILAREIGRTWKRTLALLLLVSAFEYSPLLLHAESPSLQVIPTSTPVSFQMPSPLPFVTPLPVSTDAPTRTPTLPGPVLLEALTEANVRAQPDPDSERLGTIRAGDLYPVVGRYFRWLQLQYSQSPTGLAWVFDELVRIVGDESVIKDLSESVPTVLPTDLLVPSSGAELELPVEGATPSAMGVVQASIPSQPLPTYTFPSAAVGLPTEISVSLSTTLDVPGSRVVDDVLYQPMAPIVPIAVLIGLGILGLLVSSLRK